MGVALAAGRDRLAPEEPLGLEPGEPPVVASQIRCRSLPIASARSSWASRNAAVTSLGTKLEPTSRHEYLSTSPLRKRLRSVPFSWITSARAASAGSFTSSAPPSPQVTFFVEWKLRQPRSPAVPALRPSRDESRACAASSTSFTPRARASSPRRPMSHIVPA